MSEQELGAQQTGFERKPLSQITFGEVYDAFRSFKPPAIGQDRGGFIVGKPPLNRPGHPFPIYSGTEEMFMAAPSYHVEGSFNPEQGYYVDLTDSTLAGLCYGKLIGDPSEIIQPLSAVIVQSAKGQENPLFRVAVCDGVLAVLKTFGENDECLKLMPALYAMLQNAGYGGISIAVRYSIPFLAEAIDGGLVGDNRGEYIMPKSFFVGLHPTKVKQKAGEVYDWEAQCRGEAFARVIMNGAMTAAIGLAREQNFVDSYDPSAEKVETDISEHVRVWAQRRMGELLAEKGLYW